MRLWRITRSSDLSVPGQSRSTRLSSLPLARPSTIALVRSRISPPLCMITRPGAPHPCAHLLIEEVNPGSDLGRADLSEIMASTNRATANANGVSRIAAQIGLIFRIR